MNRRYLFEAKGTTKLQTIEKTMSKAMGQVKNYPETAEAKIAIVSYMSADDRFFPSTSFVIDPPALPEEIEPDVETSRLLHFEKVLQFAGLTQTAKAYLSTLSQRLREEHRVGVVSLVERRRSESFQQNLRVEFQEESQTSVHETVRYRDFEFLGRSFEDSVSKIRVFFGVRRQALEAGISFGIVPQPSRTELVEIETEINSTFADGTLLRVTRSNVEKK
jgi:hypothetical protein